MMSRVITLMFYQTALGSSPRVWGQVFLQLPMILKPHIIPTRVGTSIHQDEATPHLQDHPHACGDKRRARAEALKQRGSSPRVWGQDSMIIKMMVIEWIIPTRVGTRPSNRTVFVQYLDHPHACGDKSHRQQ